jgi:hypothetical protein
MKARPVRLAFALLVALSASGCAAIFRAYDVAPNGLARHDDALRRMMADGLADSALLRVLPDREASPGDALLRDLYHGAIAHYAGRYDESNRHLHRAAELAEQRAALSVSRAALSYLTSDRILQYEPGHTERLLVPYYAAQNYLKLGDLGGAVVEARRLAFALQDADDRGRSDDTGLHATLREFAGAVFAAAGEWNDADVAFRNAAATGRSVVDGVPPAGHGIVVIAVENGFVAHRVETSLNVMLHPDEIDIFRNGDSGDKLALAGLVAARVADHAAHASHLDARYGFDTRTIVVPAPYRPAMEWKCRTEACADSSFQRSTKPYLLRLAWPSLREATRLPPTAHLVAEGGDETLFAAFTAASSRTDSRANGSVPSETGDAVATATAVLPALRFADVSGAVISDFQRERAAILARTIVRGAAKLAITQSAERRATDRDEAAGWLVGVLGNVGSAILEQADTRSWHLLPAGIGLLRVPLPEGRHNLAVEIGGGRRIDLGEVDVAAGRTTFVSARAW